MSDINDQSSDTSSEVNWPLDAAIEGHQHDRVVFENVADQYVKGEDVTAFFTILQDIKVNAEEDRIGLLRVGCTNIKDCLVYASVQFNPSTTAGSVRHGTALFPAASLPNTDDEFYQFCYLNKGKNLGSSIPFQLNCALDDIDVLSNAPVRKAKPDGLIGLVDDDNDELVVIHTKQMLTEKKLRQENRDLFESNRRLEMQRDEYRVKLDLVETKQKEKFSKLANEIQTHIASRKAAIEELSVRQQTEAKLRTEYDACRSLSSQHQAEATQHAERCRALEENQAKVLYETSQMRNQLAVQSQFTKDQATQIVDLERRLMQADELSKTSTQRQASLEQQLRDLRLTSEKHHLSMTGQLEALSKQYKDQAIALEESQEKNDLAQREIESLRTQLDEKESDAQAYAALKLSCAEIEKRCVRHQKSEIETKRQLTNYQTHIDELQRENQDLHQRLTGAEEEYRALYCKCLVLEKNTQMKQFEAKIETKTTEETEFDEDDQLDSILRNSDMDRQKKREDEDEDEDEEEEQQQRVIVHSAHSSLVDPDAEVRQCPVCYWEFPEQMNVDGKRDHIEHHFQ